MHDFHDVLAFHQRFDLPSGEVPDVLEHDIYRFRTQFLYEEIQEYDTAYHSANMVKTVDALLDFVYVGLGTAFFMGAPRSGYQGVWPTFQTARSALIRHRILEEGDCIPVMLDPELHIFTHEAMRFAIRQFSSAYQAAHHKVPGALELQLATLKDAIDQAYKAAAMMCVPWESCWRHVQAANMKKRRARSDGGDSKRFSPWDVVKPTGWIAPDVKIAHELMLQGWSLPGRFLLNCHTGKLEEVH